MRTEWKELQAKDRLSSRIQRKVEGQSQGVREPKKKKNPINKLVNAVQRPEMRSRIKGQSQHEYQTGNRQETKAERLWVRNKRSGMDFGFGKNARHLLSEPFNKLATRDCGHGA